MTKFSPSGGVEFSEHTFLYRQSASEPNATEFAQHRSVTVQNLLDTRTVKDTSVLKLAEKSVVTAVASLSL